MSQENETLPDQATKQAFEQAVVRVSPISGVAPPIEGQWKPGQSGNPGGRPKRKPLTDAIMRIIDAVGADKFAAAVAAKAELGDIAAFREMADRLEGKVAQPIGGSDDLGPVKVAYGWTEPEKKPE